MQRMTKKRYRSLMLNAMRIQADRRGISIAKLPPEMLSKFGIQVKETKGEICSSFTFDVKMPKKLPKELDPPELWTVVQYIESYGMDQHFSKKAPKKPKPLEEPTRGAQEEMTELDVRKILGD